jgi:hypothetical protein
MEAISPLEVAQATPVSSAEEFDRWLRDHGASEPQRIVAIYKKASGEQTVTFEEPLEWHSAKAESTPKPNASTTSATPSASSPAAPAPTGRPPIANACGASSARVA